MAYDEELADRVRELVDGPSVTEQKMFGGLAFLVDGNMALAASSQGGLLVRVGPATSGELIATTAAEAMVMRGRPVAGWLRIPSDHLRATRQLRTWVERGVSFAQSMPAKSQP